MKGNEQEQYDRFDRLIARHSGFIERLCMRHAWGDAECCKDLRQDCYIYLWRYLPTLREGAGELQERMWVFWHCRSVFSHRRTARRTLQFLPLDDDMADTIGAQPDDSARDTLDALDSLLTPSEQHAFRLMADGYTAEELAQELGIKHRSAVSLRYRIIQKLRQAYNNDNNNNRKDPL